MPVFDPVFLFNEQKKKSDKIPTVKVESLPAILIQSDEQSIAPHFDISNLFSCGPNITIILLGRRVKIS